MIHTNYKTKSGKYYYLLYLHKEINKTLHKKFNKFIIIMGVYAYDNKLLIIKTPKTIHFDLQMVVNNGLSIKLIVS